MNKLKISLNVAIVFVTFIAIGIYSNSFFTSFLSLILSQMSSSFWISFSSGLVILNIILAPLLVSKVTSFLAGFSTEKQARQIFDEIEEVKPGRVNRRNRTFLTQI